MGLFAQSAPIDVVDRRLAMGRLPRRGGQAHGIRVQGLLVAGDLRPDSLIPHAKASGQYLNSILAKTEIANAGYDEAILLDVQGTSPRARARTSSSSATACSSTPGHTNSILDGITRQSVIQIASDLGYPVEERDIARAELFLADEVFLTGTAAELVPVREVDDHAIGEPGEVTRVIQAKFEDALHGRAHEYLEWLDIVEQPSKVTS